MWRIPRDRDALIGYALVGFTWAVVLGVIFL